MSRFRRRQMLAAAGGGAKDYIVFADPVVAQICATNWGDGVGITPAQAAAVTNQQFGTTFKGNTQITSFDELQYFTGLTQLNESFWGCTALERVTIPSNLLRDYYGSFRDTNLKDIYFLGSSFSCHYTSFMNTYRPLNVHLISSDYSVIRNTFNGNMNQAAVCIYVGGTLVTEFVIQDGETTVDYCSFQNFNYGVTIDVPSSVTSIGESAMDLRDGILIFRSSTPPTLTNGKYDVGGYFTTIYVPYSADHSVLAAYQAASTWSDIASQIHELNPDGTIPT